MADPGFSSEIYTPEGGAQPFIWQHFCRKLHENESFNIKYQNIISSIKIYQISQKMTGGEWGGGTHL